LAHGVDEDDFVCLRGLSEEECLRTVWHPGRLRTGAAVVVAGTRRVTGRWHRRWTVSVVCLFRRIPVAEAMAMAMTVTVPVAYLERRRRSRVGVVVPVWLWWWWSGVPVAWTLGRIWAGRWWIAVVVAVGRGRWTLLMRARRVIAVVWGSGRGVEHGA
jgi:hypothetical protein